MRLRHDLDGDNVKDGWTTSTAVELVDAQGQPIWRTAWTAEEAGRLPRYDATSKFGDKVFGYIVEYGDTIIRVADQLGVRDYDRRTGERLRTWSAPKASSQYFVDDGSFSARGKTKCKGETDHGQFAQVCGGSLLFFDGYTFAVLDAQNLTQRAITNLDAKSTSRSADGADFVVKLAAGGTKLTVKGILYMD